MKRSLPPLALLLSLVSPAICTPSMDLTPVPKVTRVDGAVRTLVFFRSDAFGKSRLGLVEYCPPWPISGTTESARMDVPDRDASASIRTLETSVPLDLDDDAAVTEWVSKNIPADASRFQVEKFARDPVKLNGQSTVEVIFTYTRYGRAVQKSALLCHRRDRPLELCLFELVAKPEHFKDAHRAFQASLYSLVGF